MAEEEIQGPLDAATSQTDDNSKILAEDVKVEPGMYRVPIKDARLLKY